MATGALIVGTAIAAGGQIHGGIQAKKAAKKRANLLREQAAREKEAAEFDALQQERAFEKLMGRQRLAFAASGVELAGSPLLLLEETLRDKQETINNILRGGEARAGALSAQAREVKRAGRNALIGSILGATGTVLTGAGRAKAGGFGGTSTNRRIG